MPVSDILTKYSKSWMKVEGVIGTGEGLYKGKACVKVFVISHNELIKKKIPTSVENIPVIIEVTGKVETKQ